MYPSAMARTGLKDGPSLEEETICGGMKDALALAAPHQILAAFHLSVAARPSHTPRSVSLFRRSCSHVSGSLSIAEFDLVVEG
jgi:hypothetical protein